MLSLDGNSAEFNHVYYSKEIIDLMLYCEVVSKYETISLKVWLEPFYIQVWALLSIFFPIGSIFAFKPIRFQIYNLFLHPFYILMDKD